DIDRLMGKRTRERPVAAGRIEPGRALEFGLTLSAFSFVLLASAVNVLTAALALAGNLFYVLVYTRWLKRSTPQNIVIGGAAGAVALGGPFLVLTLRLRRVPSRRRASLLFHYSLLYLALLFVAMALDVL